MDWQKIWNDITTFFEDNVWNIVIFFAVLLIGIIVVKLILNVTRRILNKTKMEKIAVGFICTILKILLYLGLTLILLSIIGIEITGLLTALSALLLAVGLALQNNIANAANGIIIVSNKMFKKGDYIEVDGREGNILAINFLFTTLLTSDNKKIYIPNSTIINNPVVNYDSSKTRRVDIKFNVAYESDVEKVKSLILDSMKSNGKVLLNPAPFCRLNALNSSSIEFVAKCWCDDEDYWDVYHDILETVYNELKRNEISIPYNQLEIRQRDDKPTLPVQGSGLPKRIEKIREENHTIDLESDSLSDIFKKRAHTRNKNLAETLPKRKLSKRISAHVKHSAHKFKRAKIQSSNFYKLA